MRHSGCHQEVIARELESSSAGLFICRHSNKIPLAASRRRESPRTSPSSSLLCLLHTLPSSSHNLRVCYPALFLSSPLVCQVQGM